MTVRRGADLMNGQYFFSSCRQARLTGRNELEQKRQSGGDNGSQFDASELSITVWVADGHPCGNHHHKCEGPY